jgi:hypothetical protein
VSKHSIGQQTVTGKMENLQQNTRPRAKHAMFRTWASDNKASKQERMLRFGTKSGSAMSSVSPSKGAGAPHCARVQELQRAIPDGSLSRRLKYLRS